MAGSPEKQLRAGTAVAAAGRNTPERALESERVAPQVEDFATHARAQRKGERRRRIFRGAVGATAVLVFWHFASLYYDLQVILPSPFTVLRNTFETLFLLRESWLYGDAIYLHLGRSLLRGLVGFTLALAVAIPLGLLVGRFRTVREFVRPVVMALYPIPGIAWVPIAILWFGLTNTAVVFVVFATVFFPIFFNTESGVRAISPVLLDAARCYGASGLRLFRRVVLPAAVPYIVTGLRLGLGGAWRMIVAAEMIAGVAGMGFILMQARFFFRAADLMMFMVLVSIVGYTTEKLIVGTIERRTIEKYEVST